MRRTAILAAAVLLAASARAGGVDLPPPDPEGTWRVITQDDATSASRCIGRPETPLCAVETLIACHTRQQASLCEIVGQPWPFKPELFPDDWSRYRLIDVRVADHGSTAGQDRRSGVTPWAPGDVLIEVVEEMCMGPMCDHFPGDTIFAARRIGEKWRIVTWRSTTTD